MTKDPRPTPNYPAQECGLGTGPIREGGPQTKKSGGTPYSFTVKQTDSLPQNGIWLYPSLRLIPSIRIRSKKLVEGKEGSVHMGIRSHLLQLVLRYLLEIDISLH